MLQNHDPNPLGRITGAGMHKDGTGVHNHPMRILDTFGLMYLLEGEGRYQDGLGGCRKLRKGDLVFIFPNVAHAYGPVRADQHWDEFYLIFNGPVFELWRREGVLDPAKPVWHVEPVDYWLRRFQQTIPKQDLPGPRQTVECICALQQALADARQAAQLGAMCKEDEKWLAQAYALLEADIARPLDYTQTVRALGVSYETFRKKFVRLAGIPPAKYRQRRVLDRACELMHDRHATNREVALALGFSDEHHFSRRFKQVIGKSPSQFRGYH
ncbi:MAG: AraC family transcriptional regulator [Kiritimatiellae bacterium]|nr:AraC family transcriptional regulator [Kiritimatiellia bacterium]